MCRRVSCGRCGKPTFAGCGAHVEQVLGDVPKAERCRCGEVETSAKPQAEGETPSPRKGWLGRVFGQKGNS